MPYRPGPLPTEDREIDILGLDERSESQRVPFGALTLAVNVEFNEDGAINKRRGYDRIPVAELSGNTVDHLFLGCATYRDELVVFGYGHLYAVTSQTGAVPSGTAIVERCPLPRSTVTYQDVAVTVAPSSLVAPG